MDKTVGVAQKWNVLRLKAQSNCKNLKPGTI